MKSFFRTLIITGIIFTVIFTPVMAWWEDIQDSTIFGGELVLSNEMPVMVDENSEFFQSFQNSNRINVLLMGINTKLADTIMLVSYDQDTGNIDIISVPRDTYYPREGYSDPTDKKINAAYKDGGPLGLATAVSDELEGIPINFYMMIEYEGVKNIVDAMGGVPMDVPFHMHYTDIYDTPPLYIDIPEGYQVLDGDTAIKFLRFRKGDKGYRGYTEGDIGRIKTQQEFMKSAFKQALGLNIIKVINSVLDNVESDVKVRTVVSIAKKATNLSSDKLTTYTIPGTADYGEGNLSFWFPDKNGIRDMLYQIYSPQPVQEEVPAEGEMQ